MEGFQIKFLLLQKAMTYCQIKRKRKKACRFFFLCVWPKFQSENSFCSLSSIASILHQNLAHSQANSLSCDALQKTASLLHCGHLHKKCDKETIIWPCGSLTHREIARREEREKTKNHCAFLTVLSLSFMGAKEISLLFLEEICQVFLDLNPLAIATVRLEFWGLVALLVGNCRQTSIN